VSGLRQANPQRSHGASADHNRTDRSAFPGLSLLTGARSETRSGFYESETDDHGFLAGGANQPFYTFGVTRKYDCLVAQCDCHDNGVNHIGGSGLSQQAPSGVCLMPPARQESAELGLSRRPAHLGHNRGRNHRNNAKLQTGLVFRPPPPLVSIGGRQKRRIVNKAARAGRRAYEGSRRYCASTLRRASCISSAVNRPCCFSHWATAAKPARRCKASRAARDIQAETLTPSRVAAARRFS